MTSVTFPPSLGGDGSTVSDDSNPATGLGNGGHRTRFVPAMGQVLACMNGALDQAQDKVDEATAQAVLADSSADASAASAVEAAGYAATALSAPGTNATSTSSLTIGTGSKSLTLAQTGKSFAPNQFVQLVNSTGNYMLGNITAFTSGTGAMTVDVTHIGGSGTLSSWTVSPAIPSQIPSPAGNGRKALVANAAGTALIYQSVGDVTYTPRTSNTMLTVDDKGRFIDITSGTFTQTFDSMANLPDGWFVWIRNNGGGKITIPASDGVTNWIMYDGEARLFMKDQANGALKSAVAQSFYLVETTSGNFIKPPGYRAFGGEMWGGGQSGGKYSTSGVICYGGAGGGYAPFRFAASALAASVPFTVGSGGAQVADLTQNGNIGGTSSFNGISAYGGASSIANAGGSGFYGVFQAGGNQSNEVYGGAGAQASNSPPGYYGGVSANATAASANTVYGGAAGQSISTSNTIISSGATIYGGAGGIASLAGNPGNGVAPGGGGGATRSGTASTGARGEFRIWGVM